MAQTIKEILRGMEIPSIIDIDGFLDQIIRYIDTKNLPKNIGSLHAELENVSGKNNMCLLNAICEAINNKFTVEQLSGQLVNSFHNDDGFGIDVCGILSFIIGQKICVISVEDPKNISNPDELMSLTIHDFGEEGDPYIYLLLEGGHFSPFIMKENIDAIAGIDNNINNNIINKNINNENINDKIIVKNFKAVCNECTGCSYDPHKPIVHTQMCSYYTHACYECEENIAVFAGLCMNCMNLIQ